MGTLIMSLPTDLIPNGKAPILCQKCGVSDSPYIKKSHYTSFYKTWLYKVTCAHCGGYIKFINEEQEKSGKYEKPSEDKKV